MEAFIARLLNAPNPIRSFIVRLIKRRKLGSYRFRMSIGALDRPHYAHIVYNAAQLAQRLGIRRISVLEYGVAGGRGLLSLEDHATEVEKIFGVQIDIYGFDTGKGLPPPQDYRDLPYHWKEGFFAMEKEPLQNRLRRAKVVFGDIADTAESFFQQYSPAPIGAIAHDFDFYSSTAEGLKMLTADEKYFLPRMFCYFDDTIGHEVELYNDYTGERLAIHEFNAANPWIKLCAPYYLLGRRTRETWHHQIWICHFFKHSQYNTFVSEEGQQRRL